MMWDWHVLQLLTAFQNICMNFYWINVWILLHLEIGLWYRNNCSKQAAMMTWLLFGSALVDEIIISGALCHFKSVYLSWHFYSKPLEGDSDFPLAAPQAWNTIRGIVEFLNSRGYLIILLCHVCKDSILTHLICLGSHRNLFDITHVSCCVLLPVRTKPYSPCSSLQQTSLAMQFKK